MFKTFATTEAKIMRKLRTDLRRLVDGTKRQLDKLVYLNQFRQKRSFERVIKQLDAFNENPNYTPEEFLTLIDEIIQIVEQLDKSVMKNTAFAFHYNQLELFLIQIYYQLLKYGDNKRTLGYDLSDQDLVKALDKIYQAFLSKMGETDPLKFKGFRDKLEKSRLETVVNFLVDVQSQRGLEGLLELRTYLQNLQQTLEIEEAAEAQEGSC
jgi:hypothetical protein